MQSRWQATGLTFLTKCDDFILFCPYSTDDGSNVNVYIVDTGIWPTHDDFGNRASIFYDAVGGSVSDNDRKFMAVDYNNL